jgi:alkanesulfonate monooxygenase SsuD/methylene tetrahydromethanopterin reductase-like flavin-dependent oxidoreductase (luciferase family)
VTSGRRGVALTPMETRRDVIVRTAVLADELGYEIFSVPEGWGLDSAPVLTEIALRTARINLASGILSVWGRTPATLAMTAATLHQVCGGRYVLGLGASTKAARCSTSTARLSDDRFRCGTGAADDVPVLAKGASETLPEIQGREVGTLLGGGLPDDQGGGALLWPQ